MDAYGKIVVILTCEHGGNRVPAAYSAMFARCSRVLASHRGWDPGALELARVLARGLPAPLISATVTRLLVDLNRSIRHPALCSQYTRTLVEEERIAVLQRYYHPFRTRVESAIERALLPSSPVVAHFSIHTFTPVLRGQVRNADIGLLYDPRRALEKDLCEQWRRQLQLLRSDLRIRKNYPYLGTSDGFTTHLRRRFGSRYLGIELEVNQRWPRRGGLVWRLLQRAVLESLRGAIGAIGKTV